MKERPICVVECVDGTSVWSVDVDYCAERERVFINSVSSSVVVWSCIIEQDVKSLSLSHTDLILIWDLFSVLMFKLPTPNRISALDHSGDFVL